MTRYLTVPSRVLVIISTMIVALTLLLASSVLAVGPGPVTTDYRVQSGDTLWTIAERVGGESADVRAVVSEIRHLNRLDTSLIHPGDVLAVPAEA